MSPGIHLEYLPRGGVVFGTGADRIQFAAPPETIKDTMKLADGVPSHFMIPPHMFDIQRGISLADMEFPVYYNFFQGGNKTAVICTVEQKKRLQNILKEALFGPESLDVIRDYSSQFAPEMIPDLTNEIKYFRKHPFIENHQMTLSDLVQFKVFKDNQIEIGSFKIRRQSDGCYSVVDCDGNHLTLDQTSIFAGERKEPEVNYYAFRQPVYGVTILGAGDGFNPDSTTSGMIVWVNRRGIIVDPPVNTTEELAKLGVSPKLIDGVILTHCHSDHDAGTIQLLMQEGRLNLYTTQTIFKGFLRKISSLTCIEKEHLRKMVVFHPVKVGNPERIGGAVFHFQYNLHSIPTISLRVSLQDVRMVYSSDSQNDPDFILKMYRDGVIGEARKDQLLQFPWDSDIVFHEAGAKPLHTPIEFLCNLPESVRKRMYLLHTDLSKIPPDSGLKIAPTGLANTIVIDVGKPLFDSSIEVLDVLAHVDLFHELPIEKAREILLYIRRYLFKKGEYIYHQGDEIHFFNIILHGAVEIVEDQRAITTLSKGDFFGVSALLEGHPHTADAKALTDVEILAFKKDDFLALIQGTGIAEVLAHLARIQNRELWDLVWQNPVFSNLTPTQIIHLHRSFKSELVIVPPERYFIKEGQKLDSCYVIRKGKVRVLKNEEEIDLIQAGEIFGVTAVFEPNSKVMHGFKSVGEVELYQISRDVMIQYMEKYPGVYVRLYYANYIQDIAEASCL